MSWSIAELVNTVKISKKCAKGLYDASEYKGEIWDGLDEVAPNGKLYFNPDHMEHMDYLQSNHKFLDVLSQNKVTGDICFGSLDGDDFGSFWGYRFDGKGGMSELEGKLTWYAKK